MKNAHSISKDKAGAPGMGIRIVTHHAIFVQKTSRGNELSGRIFRPRYHGQTDCGMGVGINYVAGRRFQPHAQRLLFTHRVRRFGEILNCNVSIVGVYCRTESESPLNSFIFATERRLFKNAILGDSAQVSAVLARLTS